MARNQQCQAMIEILLQIRECQPVTALFRTHTPARDQRGDMAITFAIGGEQHQLGPVFNLHFGVVPPLYALFSCSTTRPAPLRLSRSLAIAGRVI